MTTVAEQAIINEALKEHSQAMADEDLKEHRRVVIDEALKDHRQDNTEIQACLDALISKIHLSYPGLTPWGCEFLAWNQVRMILLQMKHAKKEA